MLCCGMSNFYICVKVYYDDKSILMGVQKMRNCKKVYVEVRVGHLTDGVFDTESRKRFVEGKNRVIT